VRDRRRSISSHVRDFLRGEDVIPRNHRCMWVFDGIEVPICPGPGSPTPAIEPIGLGDALLLEISTMQEIGRQTGRLVRREVNVIIR
jgi:hypothetical protein